MRGERPRQGRPDELRRLGLERLEQPGDDGLVGVALEVGVGTVRSRSFLSAIAATITSRVRGSLKPERMTSARNRTYSSLCCLTAASSAGTATAGIGAPDGARGRGCESGSRDRPAGRWPSAPALASPEPGHRAGGFAGRAAGGARAREGRLPTGLDEPMETSADDAEQSRTPQRRQRASSSVDVLQRELEVGLLVARERDRIDAGIARRAVRRLLAAARPDAGRRGSDTRGCRPRRTSGSPRCVCVAAMSSERLGVSTP